MNELVSYLCLFTDEKLREPQVRSREREEEEDLFVCAPRLVDAGS